jgi:hypothetical protein
MIGYLNNSTNTYNIIETHRSNCHARKQVGFWNPVTSVPYFYACASSSSSMLTQSSDYGKSWSESGS